MKCQYMQLDRSLNNKQWRFIRVFRRTFQHHNNITTRQHYNVATFQHYKFITS